VLQHLLANTDGKYLSLDLFTGTTKQNFH